MIASFDPKSLPPPPTHGSVVSIGVFDGVHLGHQAILHANTERSLERNAVPTVVTFRRHPKRVLLGREPRTLTSLEHRLALFRRAGIEHSVVLTFDEDLRSISAENFAARFLVERLGATAFVLGFDSKFGRDRRGTPALLRDLGFDVEVVPQVVVGKRAVSSTAIREAVELGDLEAAQTMLGRAVSVLGTVVHGQSVGAGLGFPTANLNLHHELHPPVGVYACRTRIYQRHASQSAFESEPGDPMHAVANIGYRPTLGRERPSAPIVEVHLLEFQGELYGATLELEFVARLRGEERFKSLTSLRSQIDRDISLARQILHDAGPKAPLREERSSGA